MNEDAAARGDQRRYDRIPARFDTSQQLTVGARKKMHVTFEIANGDSPVTDVLWTHYYQPDKIGQDTLWHNARYPSQLMLPVHE